MKKVGNWFALTWRPVALFTGVSLFFLALLWFRLDSLVPGFSDNELSARASSGTTKILIANPLELPHKLLQFVPQYFKHFGPLAMRSASTIIGLFGIICFYVVLRGWYTKRIALLGTLLFATSSWFLHFARLGTADVSYILFFGVVACTIWLQKERLTWVGAAASMALVVALLYMPGMVWFVVPALFWQIARIARMLSKQNPAYLTLLAFIGTALMIPLGWALYKDPTLIRTYFGLPQMFPAPLDILNNIAHVPSQIFLQGPKNPEIWLGRLALLDWFASTMFVLGAYAFWRRRKLDRTWIFIYVFVVGSIFVGLQGPVSITLLLPFVYVFVAAGVALMLQQWFTVFPVNPFARWAGASLLILAVVLTSFYNVSHYFVAWPNAPETKQVFHNKP